ncbi:hypothetical protein Mapa_009828 [Marchantia paleacea]|nr:hypothetical protein Mapa_009828 [Marchantia paleacea]
MFSALSDLKDKRVSQSPFFLLLLFGSSSITSVKKFMSSIQNPLLIKWSSSLAVALSV